MCIAACARSGTTESLPISCWWYAALGLIRWCVSCARPEQANHLVSPVLTGIQRRIGKIAWEALTAISKCDICSPSSAALLALSKLSGNTLLSSIRHQFSTVPVVLPCHVSNSPHCHVLDTRRCRCLVLSVDTGHELVPTALLRRI